MNFGDIINEAAYPGNIGFQELINFYRVANKTQMKKMQNLIEKEDWLGFKKLIRKTLGINLQ